MGNKLETKFSKIDETLSSFEVSFAKSEVDSKVNEELAKIQRDYEIKGFRKGKVPMNLVKQRFGNEVFYNTCIDTTQDEFNKFVQENKLELVAPPVLKDLKTETDTISAVLEYETHPIVELIDFKEMSVEEAVYVADDTDIEFMLKKIAIEMGSEEDAEAIEDSNYVVFGDFVSKDKTSGEILQDMPNNVINLFSYDFPETFVAKFVGKKKGDEFEIDFAEVDPLRENETFTVKINDVKKKVAAEITPEVISDLSNGRFDTVEDLKEDIGLFLQNYFDHYSSISLENNILRKIQEYYKELPIPQSLLNESIDNAVKAQASKAKVKEEQLREDAKFIEGVGAEIKRQYVFEVISAEIIKKEGLNLEDEDIAGYFESVGLPREMGSLEVLKNIDDKNKSGLINKILSDKVIGYLKSVVVTNNVNADEKIKKMYVSNLSYYNAIMQQRAQQAQHHHHAHDEEEGHVHDENCNHDH